jgi:hypothetical protein
MLSSTRIMCTRIHARAPLVRPKGGSARRHTRTNALPRILNKSASTHKRTYTQTSKHAHDTISTVDPPNTSLPSFTGIILLSITMPKLAADAMALGQHLAL